MGKLHKKNIRELVDSFDPRALTGDPDKIIEFLQKIKQEHSSKHADLTLDFCESHCYECGGGRQIYYQGNSS